MSQPDRKRPLDSRGFTAREASRRWGPRSFSIVAQGAAVEAAAGLPPRENRGGPLAVAACFFRGLAAGLGERPAGSSTGEGCKELMRTKGKGFHPRRALVRAHRGPDSAPYKPRSGYGCGIN